MSANGANGANGAGGAGGAGSAGSAGGANGAGGAGSAGGAGGAIRVTVWNENVHDRRKDEVRAIYPAGIHEAIAAGIRTRLGNRAIVRTATLEQPAHGLTPETLADTDVLTWWGHAAHDEVSDETVQAVHQRVLAGMGLLVLHSAHYSKIFRALMGTTCSLRWRVSDDREVVFTVAPSHPIAAGVPAAFVIPRQEMYGEFFDIPRPDDLVFISSYSGGEVLRSGLCYTRGRGRVFYLSPGHETYPVYHQPEIQLIIANAVRWAAGRDDATGGDATGGDAARGEPYKAIKSPTGWFEDPAREE